MNFHIRNHRLAFFVAGVVFSLLTNLSASSGAQKISFQTLGKFPCVVSDPDQKPNDKDCAIPESVLELNGRKVSIEGFMIPLEGDDDGRITSFILVQDQLSCCFGGSPKLNAWVFVEMQKNKFAEFSDLEPIVVTGLFDVGFSQIKGEVLSLYRMKGESASRR